MGRFLTTFAQTRDERDEIERTLHSTRDTLKLALIAANGIGVWEWHVREDRLCADPTVADLFGIEQEQGRLGATFSEYAKNIHPNDLERVQAAILLGTSPGNEYAEEYRLLSSGGERHVSARGRCTHTLDGTPLKFTGIVIDVTDRKRAEQSLQLAELSKGEALRALAETEKLADQSRLAAAAVLAESEGQFRLLVEGVNHHALLTMDCDGIVTSWNRGVERLLGYKEKQILGHSFACLFTPQDVADGLPERQIAKARAAGRAEDEGWRVRADGTSFWAIVTKTAFYEQSGTLRGFTIILQDTTEKKQVSIALEAAQDEKRRLQETFLSNVSHELRTPLTAIYFFVSNVTDGLLGAVAPGQQDQLLLALENVSQLQEMVGDLLEITRADSLKLTIVPRRVDAQRVVTEVLSACRRNAERKSLAISSEIEDDLPYAWADPHRLKQILTNLIDNAIKFTSSTGSIVVSVGTYGRDSGLLQFSVRDTGCGILPEHLEMVFDRLAQVKSGTASSREGLGLGLSIARELVSQHCGSMWVESEPGLGSRFFFTLPLFTMSGHCMPVLDYARLHPTELSLIALDIENRFLPDDTQFLEETARMAKRCIRAGRDAVLPWMEAGNQRVTLFIIACAGRHGAAAITARLKLELKNLELTAAVKAIITSIDLPGRHAQPGISDAVWTSRLELILQEHLNIEETMPWLPKRS